MFAEDFMPAVLEEVGCSVTPWKNLDVDLLQGCMGLVYPGVDYVVEKGDALDSSVSQASLPSPHPTLTSHIGNRSNHELPKHYRDDRDNERSDIHEKIQDT